jgi:hypothetical protein
MLRLDNATRDSNAGQIGAFLARKAGYWAHSVALAAALIGGERLRRPLAAVPARDPTRRTWRRGDGPHDSGGMRVSESAHWTTSFMLGGCGFRRIAVIAVLLRIAVL